MSKVLFVKASPQGGRSHSIAVANQFLDAYMKRDGDALVEIHDVFKMEMPSMDGLALNAKYSILHGQQVTGEQRAAWKSVEGMIEDFTAADKYVFAVPMWNFGVPYRLKHYLDVIIQPGYTFSYSPEQGYKGLVNGKRAFIAYASGGEYLPGTPEEGLDHCRSYMKLALSFIGVTDVSQVVVEPTLMKGPEEAARRQEEAIARARQMAADF